MTIAGNLSGQIECPITLTQEMLDPLQENSQRIPTDREENIKSPKCYVAHLRAVPQEFHLVCGWASV